MKNRKYSLRFRENLLKQILNHQKSVRQLHAETGIPIYTLYTWIHRAKKGKLPGSPTSANKRPAGEKLNLLLESLSVPEENLGYFLRSQGLTESHLKLLKEELMHSLNDRDRQFLKMKEDVRVYKERNKALEKELRRKDRALAETAALLALKKKAAEIWGEGEEE